MSSSEENEWDEYASSWDNVSSVQQYSQAAFSSLLEELEALGKTLKDMEVLDFGCGTGTLTEKLVHAGCKVTALDTSKGMLDVLRSKAHSGKWADKINVIDDITGTKDTFDLIACSSVCAFLTNYESEVQNLVTMLKPGGVWIQWDWEKEESENSNSSGLSRLQIENSLLSAGLKNIAVKTAFSIPFEGQEMKPLLGRGTKTL